MGPRGFLPGEALGPQRVSGVMRTRQIPVTTSPTLIYATSGFPWFELWRTRQLDVAVQRLAESRKMPVLRHKKLLTCIGTYSTYSSLLRPAK